MNTPIQRRRRVLAAAAVAAAFAAAAVGGASAAHAADATPDPNKTAGATVTVTVPDAQPGQNPPGDNPPGNNPPGDNPPDNNPTDTGKPGGTSRPGGGGGGTTTTSGGGAAPGCTPGEPAVPTAPAAKGNPATVDKDVYLAGQNVAATAPGFGAGEQVQLVLFSDPTLVGTFTADDKGTVHAVFPLAAETPAGPHTVQFTGWCKSIATASILVGSVGTAAAPPVQGVPVWVWWVGGGLAAVLLGFGGWWLYVAMRTAPAAVVS